MAKKLISYDDEAAGLGLPEVVQTRLDLRFAFKGESTLDISPVTHSLPVRPPARRRDMLQGDTTWAMIGNGLAESIPNDTSRNWRGHQCVTAISTPTGTDNFTIRNSNVPEFSLDGNSLRISMKVNRPDLINQLEIMIGTTWTDIFTWRIHPGNFRAGEPYEAVINTSGVFNGSGAMSVNPDGSLNTTSGFNRIGIRVTPHGEGRNAPIEFSLQSVELIDARNDIFPTGCVSVTFDDGWSNVYDLGKPIMDIYGIRSTQYLIAESIGREPYMSMDQVKSLHRDGHEIGLHAYAAAVHSGVNGFGYEDVAEDVARQDLATGRQWLINNGFSADSYAYPKGRHGNTTDGASVRNIVADYFQTARTIHYGVESTPPADRALLAASTGVGEAGSIRNTPDALTSPGGDIDRAVAGKSWRILVFHSIIEGTPTMSEQCSVEGFEQIMSYLDASGVEVLPVGEAMSRIVAGTRTPALS